MTFFFFTFSFYIYKSRKWHTSVSIRQTHDLHLQVAGTSAPPGLSTPQGLSTLDTDSRVPVISLKDGTRLAGMDAPKRKDLDQWLKEHPGFVADVGAFIPVNTIKKK